MKSKDYTFFKLGLWFGINPSLFFIAITAFWFVMKFLFITNYEDYAFFSFGGLILGFFISIAGAISTFCYFILNFRNYTIYKLSLVQKYPWYNTEHIYRNIERSEVRLFYKYIRYYKLKTLISLSIMTFSVFIVLAFGRLQADYEEYVSLKITNNSAFNIDSMKIIGFRNPLKIDEVNKNESIRYSYEPDYSVGDAKSYLENKKLSLVVFHGQMIDTTHFPSYPLRKSVHLKLISPLIVDTATDKFISFGFIP